LTIETSTEQTSILNKLKNVFRYIFNSSTENYFDICHIEDINPKISIDFGLIYATSFINYRKLFITNPIAFEIPKPVSLCGV
jgi:hypothetical protein